ncbi:MAG: ribonuclease III [Xanthomonadales bacterium]|nr:ribonuclease III [Xanthomonadales bacterium]
MSFPGLDYRFENPGLLRQALTHRSAGNPNNERLEFLGDSILNFVVADELFQRFPDADEGDLSRLRAKLVRKETLAAIANDLALGEHLNLGQGEKRSGGQRRSSILADAVEAVLGAVFLDGGYGPAADLIRAWFKDRVANLPPAEQLKDAKTRLQEYLQGRQLGLPDYELLRAEGADHARTFFVACDVPGLSVRVERSGSSRRKAEQAAAAAALEAIDGQRG